ncbi:MAG: PEFG-CTERM sorting domain-containing protein, partial [Nitrososphaeria archaeon]|nr:PEFG-CTERM sorting domain-containing protein [Nitrosopumilaceae archaeon]NIP10178.1 PEFG-CTERM sorting domain-containing protein [Nitrosopumilaceae archaeon]NIP91541.1 PEFG-CTERM sorting domain-containing protein [Nitrososphaeria archaeon]NIS95376.1 PEFG-CTERM sorting domain-containing protein [Nitrosopumilaceae archaeon]
ATVSAPQGTSVPGCEATNECYIPYEITINVGEEVTWSNDDSAAHTVTAGSAAEGPSGAFDSSLFMAGTTFSHTFEEAGIFPYFCMVHPWMEGIVYVGTAEVTTTSEPVPELISEEPVESQVSVDLEYEISAGQVKSMTADGEQNSVTIEIDSTDDGQISVTLPRDVIDAKVGDEDDQFFILVDGEEVDFEETVSTTDRTVTVEFPAGTETIEVIGTFAIPEFGTIAAVILGIAIISIIVMTTKSRLSVTPRI